MITPAYFSKSSILEFEHKDILKNKTKQKKKPQMNKETNKKKQFSAPNWYLLSWAPPYCLCCQFEASNPSFPPSLHLQRGVTHASHLSRFTCPKQISELAKQMPCSEGLGSCSTAQGIFWEGDNFWVGLLSIWAYSDSLYQSWASEKLPSLAMSS